MFLVLWNQFQFLLFHPVAVDRFHECCPKPSRGKLRTSPHRSLRGTPENINNSMHPFNVRLLMQNSKYFFFIVFNTSAFTQLFYGLPEHYYVLMLQDKLTHQMDVGFTLKEKKKKAGLRELLGLELVSLVIKKGRPRWFRHVEHKDDSEWTKHCTMTEVEETKPTARPRKIWWDGIIQDMKKFGRSRKDARSRRKWRRKIKGASD